MKIVQSSVEASGTHALVETTDVREVIERHFEVAYNDASAALASREATVADQLRLAHLLETLLSHLLAALGQSGKASTATADPPIDASSADPLAASSPTGTGASVGHAGRVVEYTWREMRTTTVSEQETTAYSACGMVNTADGRCLNFSLALTMARSTVATQTSVAAGGVRLCDPLVVNFDGGAAALSGRTFAFDLNADGQAESLDTLGAGSAYLVIDREGDGRIADGREVVGAVSGAVSGDAFADLAKDDSDGNGWLDEADPAFAALRLWRRDDAGVDRLTSLADAGIGALYLGASATPFTEMSGGSAGPDNTEDSNETKKTGDPADAENPAVRAYVRSTSIFLSESGKVGTLQHVDFAV